jgi:thiosulfate reductase cytochrome b subunit
LGAVSAMRLAYRAVHWLLMAVVILFLATGFGISEFRTVERLTLGLLTKQLAFRIHFELWLPLVVLLVMHVYLVFSRRKGYK